MDAILVLLAHEAQTSNFSMSVILSVGGAVVFGDIIGQDRWFELLADDFRKAGHENHGRSLQERAAQSAYKLPGDASPKFLHLENARIAAGGSMRPPLGKGFLWRARISEISGWSPGGIS
jgi:hypothetical protein